MTIPGLRTPLWSHQRAGVAFAAGRAGTLIGHEVGCGKSLTAIALLHLWDARRVLVATPLSVVGVWPEQLRRHSEWSWRVARLDRGTVADRAAEASAALRAADAGGRAVVVVNHEAVWRSELRDLALRTRWDAVVVDESHKIAAAGSRVSMFFSALGKRAQRRLGLSGTPLSHSPLSAYGQARFLDPSVFGTSYIRMRMEYAVMGGFVGPDGRPKQIVGWRNLDQFERKLSVLCHRVRKADVLDLPPEVEEERTCRLEPEAERAYRAMRRDFVAEVDGGIVTAANALGKLLRLQQFTSGTVTDDDGTVREVSGAKATLLREALEDVAGQRAVVFCRFVADLDKIRAAAEALGLRHGEVSGRQKDLTPHGTIPDGIDVLAVQVAAGGVGIDLSAASVAIYYSTGFSLYEYVQSRGRLHRPGQTKSVLVLHLSCEGTVDEDVMRALEKREDLVEGVLARMRARQEAAW